MLNKDAGPKTAASTASFVFFFLTFIRSHSKSKKIDPGAFPPPTPRAGRALSGQAEQQFPSFTPNVLSFAAVSFFSSVSR